MQEIEFNHACSVIRSFALFSFSRKVYIIMFIKLIFSIMSFG